MCVFLSPSSSFPSESSQNHVLKLAILPSCRWYSYSRSTAQARGASGAGVGGHVELHPSNKGVVVAVHHATEVLAGTVVVGCGGVHYPILVPCELHISHSIILFRSKLIISSFFFAFIFFHPHNFSFFYSNIILKIKEFQLKYLKFLEFKISHNFKFSYPNTLLGDLCLKEWFQLQNIHLVLLKQILFWLMLFLLHYFGSLKG